MRGERVGARLFGGALGAVADDDSLDDAIADGGEGVDEDIDAFFAADATDPSREQPFGRELERAARLGAGEGGSVPGKGVGNEMEAVVRNPAGAELIGLGLRDGDDGVETAEGEALEGFVGAVFQSATGKTVYGGYYRYFRFAPRVPTHDVRPVTMCVYDSYASASGKGHV